MKIAAICETHYVGLVPHFTGTLSEAALVHCCGSLFRAPFSAMDMLGVGPRDVPHLPQHFDFRDGKLWPQPPPRPLVVFDPAKLQLIAEITQASRPIPMFHRPDGSITNW